MLVQDVSAPGVPVLGSGAPIMVDSPLAARTSATETLLELRSMISSAIVRAIKRDRLNAEDVARRAGTSREAVISLCVGQVPASLELLLKIAAVLSIRVNFGVDD